MIYDFDDQSPADYLDGLLATVTKATEVFKSGSIPKAMQDVTWEILLDEFRELRREQKDLYSPPIARTDGAKPAEPTKVGATTTKEGATTKEGDPARH